jgi:phosphatidylinositol-bisphosphatase
LLYSTSTAREDAWCMAAFAGLGERAILYTKVRIR